MNRDPRKPAREVTTASSWTPQDPAITPRRYLATQIALGNHSIEGIDPSQFVTFLFYVAEVMG